MAYFSYSGVGKGIAINGSTRYTFYGKDFNPNVPSLPSWNTFTCSDETSNFNLAGFQPGNEVGCYVRNVTTSNQVGDLYVESFFKRGGVTTWQYDRSFRTSSAYEVYTGYMYFGVDDDEIRSGSGSYTIETNRELRFDGGGSDGDNGLTTNFTVSNLSIDSDKHRSGHLWVEGNYLCYTDATGGTQGYKHKVNYDTGYSGGSGDAGYVWIPSGTTGRIYYTDAYGVVRRTHLADTRYGGSYYPGASTGYIYASDGNYLDGYGYLCFVDGNGELRRLGNGIP